MKTMKKLVAAALAGIMILAMNVSVFAATGVSAAEQALLDKATRAAQDLGVDTNASATFKETYAEGESYLSRNDLTDAQIKATDASIDNAVAILKDEMAAQGVTKLGDLKEKLSQKELEALETKVVNKIAGDMAKVGINIVFTADGHIVVSDAAGQTIADPSNPIKQTGFDLIATVVVAVAFAGAVAVCLVVASKKRFIEEA